MANLEHSQEVVAVVVPMIIVTITQITKTVLDHKEVLVAVATVAVAVIMRVRMGQLVLPILVAVAVEVTEEPHNTMVEMVEVVS